MPKIALRCETPRCMNDIVKYGERYHDVHSATDMPPQVDAYCARCGGKHLAAGGWIHACKQCGTAVEPGKLTGLFVPHSCAPCMEKVYAADRARGAICRRCNDVYSRCCC